MYKAFFGLNKSPFSMTPDPGVLFLTPQHREALAGLTYAILERKGFVAMTGDAGTGKTTLIARVLKHIPAARIQSSIILNPTVTPDEFLEMVLMDFGLPGIPPGKPKRLARLQSFLLQGQHNDRISALVIDEAHKLSPELLEEIRLLSNFEYADQKLLQILLVGQNELSGILNRPDLRQLKQRIAMRLSIHPLSAPEVHNYIRYRWAKAGGSVPQPFTLEAIGRVAVASRGIPRIINAICDNSLILAFADTSRSVELKHVIDTCADLDLGAEPVGRSGKTEAAAPEPSLEIAAFLNLERKPLKEAPKVSCWMRWAGKLGMVG